MATLFENERPLQEYFDQQRNGTHTNITFWCSACEFYKSTFMFSSPGAATVAIYFPVILNDGQNTPLLNGL